MEKFSEESGYKQNNYFKPFIYFFFTSAPIIQ